MSRIGFKLIASFLVSIILAIVIITVVSLGLSSRIVSRLMEAQTTSGINTVEYEFQSEVVHLRAVMNIMDLNGLNLPGASDEEVTRTWDNLKRNDHEFLAFMSTSGEIYWKSSGYNLADMNLQRISGGYVGVVNDSAVNLTLQYAMPIKNGGNVVGYAVAGRPLSDLDWIDDMGKQTNSEITIFGGNVRIGTTLVDASGNRVIGTTMADGIAKKVLTNGETYNGKAKLVGVEHYVCYQPITDIDGTLIGALFSGVSATESNKETATLIVIVIISGTIICVLAVALIAILINRFINYPIKEAMVLADDMSRGVINGPKSKFKFANDEIGDFVRKLEVTRGDLNRYIGDINLVLSEMSTGNFTVRPQVEYLGDFIEIRESLDKIEESLQGLVVSIKHSAVDVKDGSSQLTNASENLADGTTKQAAAIEELSASINAVADKVTLSAQNAGEANKVSMLSTSKIMSQNEEVSNMMDAMMEIKEKSDQIQNIIKAIDDIAFQTNILALNAAIEAARAGAAGKGFAVVADEVRNLAAKSAASAAQTGDLITATIEAVNKGTEIAQSTAGIMKEVTELSNETNRYITEISKASDEQSEAISQIKTGIDSISMVVQQNSATAEETAAACVNLSDQANKLEEQISKLRA